MTPSLYFSDHRRDPAGQVAECIGQVGVVALAESLPREAAVAIERDLAEQEVPEGVRAEAAIASPRSSLTPALLLKRSPPSSTKP